MPEVLIKFANPKMIFPALDGTTTETSVMAGACSFGDVVTSDGGGYGLVSEILDEGIRVTAPDGSPFSAGGTLRMPGGSVIINEVVPA